MHEKIYLMAVCGTGVGSLACLLKERGFAVCGSDANVYPPMSNTLAAHGIKVYSPYSADNLIDARPDLVIVGNAISKTHVEAQHLLSSGIPYVSMPQALNRFFLHDKEVIVIAGTHGKTTTTALMAFLLTELGLDPSFLVGGVPIGFKDNVHIGAGPYFIIEGDEYDTAFFDKGPKFLHYNPRHVILTSIEFDHADIYRDLDHFTEGFVKLATLIPPGGSLHVCDEYPQIAKVLPFNRAWLRSYGFSSPSWQIRAYQSFPGCSRFDLWRDGHQAVSVESPLAGEYNAQNVAACFSMLQLLGLDLNQAAVALKRFSGVKRRQEVLFDDGLVAVIDDFAHHPTAVQKTIGAIRQKFPDRRLIAVFEPRSNSSRRDVFQKDYALSFDQADEVLLARVYLPEKIANGKVLDVTRLAAEISARGQSAKALGSTGEILAHLTAELHIDKAKQARPCVVLFMSNGGFDGIHRKFIDVYNQAV